MATRRGAGRQTSCGWSLTAFCLTRPRPRPRPFPTPRALDARPVSRCSRSSDSVPAGSTAAAAGGLFAASPFFAWAHVMGAGLTSALAGLRRSRAKLKKLVYYKGKFEQEKLADAGAALAVEGARAGAFKQVQSSECLTIIAKPPFSVCGPLRVHFASKGSSLLLCSCC